MRKLDTSLKYFIVQSQGISNSSAIELITSGRVRVNENEGKILQKLLPTDTVSIDHKIIRPGRNLVYKILYKPRGIETTLNPEIENNLIEYLSDEGLFPVGRLDKDSEGLLLLSNDGRIYNKMLMAHHKQEKEYVVETNVPISNQQLKELEEGIVIMGKRTLPAKVKRLHEKGFEIILTEGKNRQIRRMCYKLGLEVTCLVRTRMLNICLSDLIPGQTRDLSHQELSSLFRTLNIPVNS